MAQTAQRALLVASGMSFTLSLVKSIAYVSSGSVVVLASLLDSLADALASVVNHFISKKSLDQADKEHPFGHGGFEVVGSLVQGMVIVFFGGSLAIESCRKMAYQEFDYIDTSLLPLSAAILAFSALGGFGIHFYLKKQVAKMEKRHERSLSLVADQAHYTGDAWANAASAVGILLIQFTEMWLLDAVIGLIASLFLMGAGVPILKKAFRDIVHNEAPQNLQQTIVDLALSVDDHIKGLHLLRSREFGPYLFVDFHLKLSDTLSLKEAHAIGERVEEKIKKKIPRADVLIHLDPESEPDQKYWDPSYTLPDPS